MTIGLIGIIVAITVYLVFVYKGYNVLYLAPVCALIVAAAHKMSLVDTFTNTYAQGVAENFAGLFAIIFLGVIFGHVFSVTRASTTIANGLVKVMVNRVSGEKQVKMAILAMLLVEGLMTMGGIDGYILTFTTFPICLILAETVNIPRRFIPGMLVLSAAFMAAPGSPQISNVMAQSAMEGIGIETSSMAYPVGGFIGVVIIAAGGYFVLTRMIIRAQRNGEGFELGNCQRPEVSDNNPPIIVAITPLVCVFLLYSVWGQNIAVALFFGIVVNIVLMWKYLPHTKTEQGKVSILGTLRDLLNEAVKNYPTSYLSMLASCGFASTLVATSTYGTLIEKLGTIDINIYILGFIVCAVVVAMTSSPVVAITISIPLVVNMAQAKGISVNTDAIFRIAVFTSITFESLPWSGLVIVSNQLADTTHRQSYKPYFYQTVVFTTLAAVVCTLMAVLGV